MTNQKGFSLVELAGVITAIFVFALLILFLTAGVPGCSVQSTPTIDPKDQALAELRKQLAEANAKLKAEATPQSEMVDQMRELETKHAKQISELRAQLKRQAELFEQMKVEPCLAGLQSRIQDTKLKFEQIDKRFGDLNQRLQEMQDEIESKSNRGHSHVR